MHLIKPKIKILEPRITFEEFYYELPVKWKICVSNVEKQEWEIFANYPIMRPDSPKMRVFPINASSSHMPARIL